MVDDHEWSLSKSQLQSCLSNPYSCIGLLIKGRQKTALKCKMLIECLLCVVPGSVCSVDLPIIR